MFGCAIAVTAPFLAQFVTPFFLVLPLMAVAFIGETMPTLCLIGAALAYVLCVHASETTRKTVLMTVAGAVVAVSMFLLVSGDYLVSNGRFSFWRVMMGSWSHSTIQVTKAGEVRIPSESQYRIQNMLTGSGSGSYLPMAESLQIKTGIGLSQRPLDGGARTQVSGVMITMHSDIMQVLFENGVIGLSLIALMLAFAWRAARKDVYVLPALYAACIWAAGNYPARSASGAFILISILFLSFNGSRNKITEKGGDHT
jgi:hypothetical protein